MYKVVILALLVTFVTALPQAPVKLTPVFPELAPRSIKSSRIINGFPASRGQFPHQVRMLAKISSTQNQVCGASIISDRFVLTAAHCTKDIKTFELGFGSTDFNNPQFSLTSDKKIEHRSYNPTNLNNDIALIELPVLLQWTTTVQPVQLPSYSDVGTTFMGRQSTVSGYGKTKDANTNVSNQLMYTYLRVIGNSECSAYYGTDIIKTFTLCTRGWDTNKQSTCQGDSGGPLITRDNNLNDNIIVGVVSFVSSRGCEAEDPAGFVRVTSYLDWIKQNTGIQIRP